jgi:hypothetical protein
MQRPPRLSLRSPRRRPRRAPQSAKSPQVQSAVWPIIHAAFFDR